MKLVDLNCARGQRFANYHLGMDDHIIDHICSANVAWGWHAGDSLVMDRTVRTAVEKGVAVGAHPGYPDQLGFGRRDLGCTPQEYIRSGAKPLQVLSRN